jgi:putative oxidoreductase
MTTQLFTTTEAEAGATAAQGGLVLFGRALFAAIFVLAGANHFSPHAIQDAAAQGVPMSSLAVPVSGALALAGGLSVLLGYRARAGAWLLVLFLVPVTFVMHPFWAASGPELAQMHRIMFLKNLSMLGGALLLTQLGAGPWSLDARRARRERHPSISPPAGDVRPTGTPYSLEMRSCPRFSEPDQKGANRHQTDDRAQQEIQSNA